METKSLLRLCQPLQKNMDNRVEFFCLLKYRKSQSLMRGSDRHTAAYTRRLSPHLESLIMQQYWHINFPLKSQWYTVPHFPNCKNISCFPKNYRKPKSLFMLLAIWFIVYLQLSWECHAFTMTNYAGGAFVDQLERWELYFLHSLKHQLNKINWQPIGDWPFYVWRKQESSTFGHSHIQTQLVSEVAQDCACWETGELDKHSTLGKAGQEFCTQWILHYCTSPILASTQAGVSSQSCTSILSQVWKQYRWTYLFGIGTSQYIHCSSSWVHSAQLHFFCIVLHRTL